ncbi:ATP-binding protein [Nocardioides insulae]|uniref:ATP-binding protein n=1 Tax=Nocardioides insulae TaxID=394734 RepID=UPI00048FBD00|nr:ATP-binding protein [Nocardioides insulae]
MAHLYPFPAVLGADPDAPQGLDDLALALVLTTVSPGIGGVLARGEKGTAKTTLVRALARVLPPIDVYAGDRFSVDPALPTSPEGHSPDGPFDDSAEVMTRAVRLVELPVGASEDRLLGSIHLERALSQGAVEFDPGLLARAHRGVLYVDEVNLLHDHLVDQLLDAAATGRVTVERDNVSVSHPARFVLVGTMNPEEGELRPQLLDRFGLSVEVAAPRDPAERAEVVRRRLAFDRDPEGFASSYAEAEHRLRARISTARVLVDRVRLEDATLLAIAELCAAFEVDGLRADIVTARTAVAHAAWQGRDHVTTADLRVAARLALPHRRRRNPFDAPGMDQDRLDDLLPPDEDPEPDPDHDPDPDGGPGARSDSTGADQAPEPTGPTGPAGENAADNAADPEPAGVQNQHPESQQPTPDHVPAPEPGRSDPAPVQLFSVAGVGEGQAGRRSRARSTSGRRVGSASASHPSAGPAGGIHLVETVRAAIPHQRARGRLSGALRLRSDDLRRPIREGREANLVLFCVDASGSMAARDRVEQVRRTVLSLLMDAYRRRDRVGLVTFRGQQGEVALAPTGSVDVAAACLDALPHGGRTPLAEGLLTSAEVIRRERLRDPSRRPLLIVVTDGRATAGRDAVTRAGQVAAHLRGDSQLTAVVVDCESGRMRLGLARELAVQLGAEHVPLARVTAEALTELVAGAA